jgi:hypothetical protein
MRTKKAKGTPEHPKKATAGVIKGKPLQATKGGRKTVPMRVTDATVTSPVAKPLVEYVYKKKRIPKTDELITEKRIGVLFATVNDDGKVGVGFSVCHNTKDRFDYVRGIIHKPGFGLAMASERAERWISREYYEPIPDLFLPELQTQVVRIPTMIQKQLRDFISRCSRYYKGRDLPKWAKDFASDFDILRCR